MKFLSKAYMFIIFALLYAPIVVLVIFSFNESGSLSEFTGISFKWYSELFQDEHALMALKNSLILAVCSAVCSTVIATFAAMGIHHMRKKYVKNAIKSITNIPMVNPDIVTGVSMMLLFVAVAKILQTNDFLGFGTMLIAHTTFNLPYVLLSVLPRFTQLDSSLSEAAMDLGCTPLQAFFKVELHTILPGIVTGMMMAFTLSLDDFVISFFTSGSDFQTLPLLIYSMTKKEVTPDMYALSTIMMAAILILMLLTNIKSDKKKQIK